MLNFKPVIVKLLVPSEDGGGWLKASAKLGAGFLLESFHKDAKSGSAFWFCYLLIFLLAASEISGKLFCSSYL